MAKLATLVDAFTGGSINTAIWNTVTGGAATLDTLNDQIVLAQPTVNGTANTFGSSLPFDATGSSIYAQITPVPNGNGGTRTTFKLSLDANNSVAMRLQGGTFVATLQTAGTTVTTTLPAYNPDLHRWWRLRESGGQWNCETSPDGLTSWRLLLATTYTWSATALTFSVQTAATTTEVAGNAAAIAHVNTRLGGQLNPNWPVMEYGAGLWWGANGASIPRGLYVDVSKRTDGTFAVTRGRQYELDQMRPGTTTATLDNPTGDLDPVTTDMFPGHVQPFQPLRIRAQWPPTINLATQGIATGGSYGGVPLGTITPSDVLDLHSETDTTGGGVVTSASAWIGSTVTQFAVPNAAAVGQRIAHSAQAAALPGPYTLQLRVRNVTAGTTLQVKAHLGWYITSAPTPGLYAYGSTVTLTGSATAAWTTITVTGTAPPNTYGIDVGVTVATTAAAACTVQTGGWQLEYGSTASPWAMPGAWNPVYAGFTEDWASQWQLGGTFGTVAPPTADGFALLSQLTLSDPLTMEISNRSPRFNYPLADPSGATTFADTGGAFPALPIGVSKAGAGTVAAGTAITATVPTGVYTGSAGTVVTITNPSPGSITASPGSYLSLAGAGITGPAGSNWTRMIAFRTASASLPSSQAVLWGWSASNANGFTLITSMRLSITSTGALSFTITTNAGTETITTAATGAADGNWHLATIGVSIAAVTQYLSMDGVLSSRVMSAPPDTSQPVVVDAIGAAVNTLRTQFWNFSGDISFAAEMAAILSPADASSLYTAWRSAAAGESTDARYARILRYAGYTGPTSIQAGMTTSMGPAAIGGQDVVTALQDVVTTESGEHFVDRAGTPTFRSRGARYNATTPVYTFGERTDFNEWPYEDCQPTFDSTHLGNQVTVTQASTGQTFYAKDNASIAAYFPRTLPRTVNSTSALECQDAAGYLLSRYKLPVTRIVSLLLHPSAIPAMWPVCLSLELGMRVRVMRRPQGQSQRQIDCFIENIAWALDKTEATVTLQCSPADTTPYAVFASWHTTLKTSVLAAVSSITVNASADTSNPLALQMAAGQQLVLGEGTANQETVTVSAVGATSPGWTSAVIALTAPTAHAHTAGDVICEPLPAGTTDPTTWDNSQFDAVAFAY